MKPTTAELYNMHEAKTHFSKLVERVERGEEILIGRAGRPVARLVPLGMRTQPRTPGLWRDQVRFGPDFDRVDAEIADLFDA